MQQDSSAARSEPVITMKASAKAAQVSALRILNSSICSRFSDMLCLKHDTCRCLILHARLSA